MRGNGTYTFLGPIKPHRLKGGRIAYWFFRYAQAGMEPFVLQYATQREAQVARSDLSEVDRTLYVNQDMLFDAIIAALADAIELGKKQEDDHGV